jgi:hypothetical protein
MRLSTQLKRFLSHWRVAVIAVGAAPPLAWIGVLDLDCLGSSIFWGADLSIHLAPALFKTSIARRAKLGPVRRMPRQ